MTATGATRVRRGYLSGTERDALAVLLDSVQHCLTAGKPVPESIRNAWAEAAEVLAKPRGEFR